MSAYRDFTRDFPERCSGIMKRFYFEARLSNLEVTLLLSVATSGLVIPFERIRLDSGGHPLERGSKHKWEKAKEEPFIRSKFWDSPASGTWRYSTQHFEERRVDVDSFGNWKPVEEELSSRVVILLRNALAHGNLSIAGDPISELVFMSERNKDKEPGLWQAIKVSPEDFAVFLTNWFNFLKNAHLKNEVIPETNRFDEHEQAA